ncbi:HNH endonuclease [Larkinella arboricola]|uniref:HNH endonuclease n=1 Tax=Larkinella arboricola TaxID=643671 RepID=A0A327WGZ0_LARAB|nr:HNH endonuclease [Larkinella arboricola]RAJ89861.1 HNH endonuclease [Larkinella arboricola]
MTSTEALVFEARDTEIFSIPDTKTKLNTLQNYFFPRLKKLLDMALQEVKEAYGIDPFERYNFVYSPSHRKEAKVNQDTDLVLIGISGRRLFDRQLKVKREDGKPYALHPASAYFQVTNTGRMTVNVWPFTFSDETYFWNLKKYLRHHYESFTALLNAGNLNYHTLEGKKKLSPIKHMLTDEYFFEVQSSALYFPIENPLAIDQLVVAFVLAFPILDICYALAEGIKPAFPDQVKALTKWLTNRNPPELTRAEIQEIQLPELDSYRFVRAGLWYQVLARDNWTCCSCRRSAKEHGIVLHVDHILPRSLGGRDELANLQTLCRKCNIGKSNKDFTDLRS